MRSLLAAALIALTPAAPGATVLVPIGFRELVTTAPIIAHGHVVDVQAGWSAGRLAVETFVSLHVDDYLKGDLGSDITVRVPGGRLGRYRTFMVGAPVFRAGEEVVLFLNPGAPFYPSIVGLSQGAFRVVSMPGSSAPMVTPPAVMSVPGPNPQPVIRGDAARRPVPIDQFRAIVRQVLAEGGR